VLTLEQLKKIPYWSLDPSEIIKILNSSEAGLSPTNVKENQVRFGTNTLNVKHHNHVIIEFLKQFKDPLILILLFASGISAALGQMTNFVIIIFMVSLSVVIDFYQEYQAEITAEKLRQKVSLMSGVIRLGKRLEIPSSQVVVGDIIEVSGGDIVPADARLIKSNDLLVNQSSLTGESFPQEKSIKKLDEKIFRESDQTNMLFQGTSIIQGDGLAVVVNVGQHTKFGQLAKNISSDRSENEFEIGIRRFGVLLMRVTFIMVVFVFVFNSFFKHDLLESFLFALALAVGLTPELLPVVITVNLSRGASRMSKKGVIVKKLSAIENLGSMQVLCTDKTGTLTKDEISLEIYEDIHQKKDDRVLKMGILNSFFQAGLKSPLEKAILKHKDIEISSYKKVDEIPFDFHRRRLSVIVTSKEKTTLITKGAPESFLPLSTHYEAKGKRFKLTPQVLKKINLRFANLSKQGFRVLAIGYKKVSSKTDFNLDDEAGLTFLGLMAFLDPPKEEVKSAISMFETQGVEIKILTGDNELVTQKICNDLDLKIKGVIVGSSLIGLDRQALFYIAKENTIFARLSPDQKESLILSLRENGLTVGYLGDGINDAPSLRVADVGMSVDNAVDVAKDVADLILLRKDLHILKDGLLEGRKTFGNVMKYIMMGTSSNFGNMFSVAIGSVFLPFLPMSPTQILLNNFLYDLSQIFLSGDKVDHQAITKPVKWDINFIKKFMLFFGPISSIFDIATYLILLYLFKANQSLFQTGWFVESLVSQTLIIFAIRTKVVPFFRSRPSNGILVSAIIITLFGLLAPFSPLVHYFGFTSLPVNFYLILSGMILVYFVLVENMKYWFYKKIV